MHLCRDDLVYVNLYHYMKFKKIVLWLLWLIGVCLLGLIKMCSRNRVLTIDHGDPNSTIHN